MNHSLKTKGMAMVLAVTMSMSPAALASGWPDTPDLRNVGRGEGIPTTFIAEVVQRPWETREVAIERAAEVLEGYTEAKGFEACARICVGDTGVIGMRIHTNHSQVVCRSPREEVEFQQTCPTGMVPSDQTIHSHPHFTSTRANPVDAFVLNVRRYTPLQIKPHDFSSRDRMNGAGYLVHEGQISFQMGSTMLDYTFDYRTGAQFPVMALQPHVRSSFNTLAASTHAVPSTLPEPTPIMTPALPSLAIISPSAR